LYDKVLGSNLNDYDELRVLSGYSSSTFLNEIVKKYPKLNIEVYIGMAKEGIARNDHDEYCMMPKNVNVYYNVSHIKNHMKIYELSNDKESIYYIGSANFSENGFFKNDEILVEVQDDLSYIYEENRINMLNCTSTEIEDHIYIYENEESTEVEEIEDEEVNLTETKTKEPGKEHNNGIITLVQKIKSIRVKVPQDFECKIVNSYYSTFHIPIVLPKESDPFWKSRGINSQPNPHIKKNPNNRNFDDFFNSEKNMTIYTFNGKVLRANLAGKFNSELHFIDINIKEYLVDLLELNKSEPIAYEILSKLDFNYLYFVRLNETDYYMSLFKE